jgi:outer membrane protein assembly factor BamB
MRQGAWWSAQLVSLVLVLALARPLPALITRLTPLADVLDDAGFIVTAKVEKLDPKRPAMVLAVDEVLKGKPGFQSMPVLLEGDRRAIDRKEPPQLLERVAVKLPLVVFVMKRGDKHFGFCYTNGTWFSILGVKVDGGLRWSFTHLEPYLRRTFKGTTKEMVQTIRDALSGKRKPPPPADKEKPGLGPKVGSKKSSALDADERPVYAVIPTVLVGGPLAMLAMLFPAAFGGWKRWLVLLSTAGTSSTLYTLHWWYADDLAGTWLGTPAALWAAMGVVNVAGVVWAWQRHLALVHAGEAPAGPGKRELIVLGVLALVSAAVLTAFHLLDQKLLTPAWLPLVAFCVALWLGCLYALYAWLRGPRMMPALSTEAVVLTGLVLASLVLGTTLPHSAVAGGLEEGEKSDGQAISVKLVWKFRLPVKGAISSSPVVAGERVYIAAAHDNAFRPTGAVYCLDRATGKVVWTFSDNDEMKPVFSTPVVAGGKLYVGEGFHQDYECKVYCLDATTGKKQWDFQTQSHTESTAFLADGRLTIGAGDDGVYCLDAAGGKVLWNFPGFHVDAPPLCVGGRVYAGCGIGDTHRTTALLCLDPARKGKLVWRMNTDHPVWSRPVVSGGFVYAGTGNGRLNESAPHPAGAVLCLRASDGEVVWKKKFSDGVLGPVGADRRHLFFGCRDGYFYCLRRRDGSQAWRRHLGSEIVAGPALEGSGLEAPAGRLYAASFRGHLTCLESQTGQQLWSREMAGTAGAAVELIGTPALEALRDADGSEVWRLYVAVTLVSTGRAGELYCFEDRTQAAE